MTFLSDEIKEGCYVQLRNDQIVGPITKCHNAKGLYYWKVVDHGGDYYWSQTGMYTSIPHMKDIVKVIDNHKKEVPMETFTEKSYVIVRFKNDYTNKFTDTSKTYTYIAEGTKEELEQYNYAVVNAPSSGYTIVKVAGVEELDMSTYSGAYKHVIAMFSDEKYLKRESNKTRKNAIEKELRQRAAERAKQKELSELLEGDEVAQKLFAEYNNL